MQKKQENVTHKRKHSPKRQITNILELPGDNYKTNI